jgi:hypothetical protein
LTLPGPHEHGFTDEATIAVPIPSEGLVLYRLLEGETPRREDFEPGWTRSQALLQGIPELSRVAISHWLEQAQAARRSERPVCYLGRIELARHPLVRVALTEREGRGHVDVWAHPQTLFEAVADVVRAERRGLH